MKRNLNYGVGALITVVISLGSAAIAYGGGLIVYDVRHFPAWILGPLGVYSLIYALASREILYYSAWGMVLLIMAIVSALYKVVNMLVTIGVIMVAVGIVAAIAYVRESKRILPKQ